MRVSSEPAACAFASTGDGAIDVLCTTIEEIFQENAVDRCDLLKLDCEGAEYEILEAIPRDLWPLIARVALEYHPATAGPEAWTGARLAEYLASVGHRVEIAASRKDPGRGHIFSSLA